MRLWLAVVVAVLVLSVLVGWLLRIQAERIRAERLSEIPSREVVLRNAAGEVVGQSSVRPVRVPGRGIEFHVQLPPGVKGGEQLAISLPPRGRGPTAGEPGPGMGAGERDRPGGPPPGARNLRWWDPPGAGDRGGLPSMGFVALLVAFALAVALGSYPVVRRLTQRLEHLRLGVERLGAGDLRARVDETGDDEVAFLAKRFNQSADQVAALMQAQKSLLANASHELRSPLARIRMGLELMDSTPSPALKTELSRNIAELDALIDEILLASRLEATNSSVAGFSKEPVDLLGLAAEEAARAHVSLVWAGAPATSAVILGDARLLRRLLRNLLENALRYGQPPVTALESTPANNTDFDIVLTLSLPNGHVRIDVSDRGPGVPESERERIFEPFYRSIHASERHGGVGLGLALVRSIAQQHGGSVHCLPREGGGARFIADLPA